MSQITHLGHPIRLQLGGKGPRITSLPKKGRRASKGRRRRVIRTTSAHDDERWYKRKWLKNWQPVVPQKEQSRERTIANVFPKFAEPRKTGGQRPRVY